MTDTWEYIIIGSAVCGALYYLGRKVSLSFSSKKDGCGSGCGCEVKKVVKN